MMTRGAAAIAAAALLFLGPAACSLIAGLDKLDFNSTGKACTSASECDDQNACTDDTCSSDGLCLQAPTADGPLATQTTGDCKTARCSAGKVINENDDTDVRNDNEDCTIDGCTAGTPVNTAQPDGAACTLSGLSGTCSFGKCAVKCMTAADCDDKNPCTGDACDMVTMFCALIPLPDGTPTPGATDVPGDCLQHACIGGVDTNAPYDPDIEVTPNDCDQDLCSNGTPSHPPQMAGTPCQTTGGAVCDGSGACVQCNLDIHCPGLITPCAHPSCTNHVCGTTNEPNGTVLMNQVPGDCKTQVCDGTGNITSINDDTDTQSDSNDCTGDMCVAGVPTHPFLPMGTMCGNMQMCNAMGQCACVTNNDCTPPATCGGGGMPNVCGCTPTTCLALGKTCGNFSDGCGGPLNCNGSQNGTETDQDCGGPVGTCADRCGQGKKCGAGTDCSSGFCVDGVCCDSACTGLCDACSAALKGQMPNGKCGLALAGTVCVVASCATATTKNNADTCTAVGTCMDNGIQNCGNYACAGGACNTNCAVDANCASTSYCNGMVCTVKKALGGSCNAANQCQSGFCADGVCCNTACNTTCKVCSAVGTCTNVVSGMNDNTCPLPNACDGVGACKKKLGAMCGLNTECLSGLCIDGYCCNTSCAGLCTACSVPGSLGTCTNVPAGGTDPTCMAPMLCNGLGGCL